MITKNCNWSTAPFNDGNNMFDKNIWDKYKDKVLDNNDNLELEYDVAYKESKGMLRMPTKDEIEELIEYTDSEWCELNGVKDRKFISKKDKSKWIFIPAGGYRYGSSSFCQGNYCSLLSPSLNESNPTINCNLSFGSGCVFAQYHSRYFGMSVRGVKT